MYNKNRKEQIKTLWNKGLGVTEISNELQIKTCNVSAYLTKIFGSGNKGRHVYKRRMFKLNEHFFEFIDCESKAYFLGLIYADGNLATGQNLVRISLHEKDKYILDKFNKSLEYNRPLDLTEKKKEPSWNRSNQYGISISCTNLRKDLEKYGLTPNKSSTLKFPNGIPKQFIFHFIRGYFDGDGCIYVGKNNKAEVSIASSEHFCNSLHNILKEYNISLRTRLNSAKNCYYGRIAGGKNIEQFYNLLYKDSTIFLERKKDIFEKWNNKRNARKNEYNS